MRQQHLSELSKSSHNLDIYLDRALAPQDGHSRKRLYTDFLSRHLKNLIPAACAPAGGSGRP